MTKRELIEVSNVMNENLSNIDTKQSNKPNKKRGPKKKPVTASVVVRCRVTHEQSSRYKDAAKMKNKNLSQFIIYALENECEKLKI